MTMRSVLAAGFILAACPAFAQDATIAYKSLSPELALDLAKATFADCQKKGFQVAVVVTDRFGNPSCCAIVSLLPHTPPTAQARRGRRRAPHQHAELSRCATRLAAPACAICRTVMIGGGITVEAAGTMVGAVGVSGASGATRMKPGASRSARRITGFLSCRFKFVITGLLRPREKSATGWFARLLNRWARHRAVRAEDAAVRPAV